MADIRRRANSDGGIGYQVRYIDKSKKSGFAYKTFAKAKQAQRFKAEKDIEEGLCGPLPEITEIGEAIELWLRICEKQGTSKRDEPVTPYTLKQYAYRGEIIQRYGWGKPLQHLTTPDIVNFKSWLLENCASRDQARKVLSSFSTMMNELALRGIITSNIASGVSIRSNAHQKPEMEIPTEKEVWTLLSAADKLANSKNNQIASSWQRYRPMLYMAADSGMRPQEYLAFPTFNLREGSYYVDRAVKRPGHTISVTKTPAGCRSIPASTDVMDMVMHAVKRTNVSSSHDLVFPTNSGHWQSIDNWRKRGFFRACEEAGLIAEEEVDGALIAKPKFTPYALRHFYASVIIDQGLDLKRIQKRMGHTRIETTLNNYGHLIERRELSEKDQAGMIGLLAVSQKSCGVDVARPL